MDKDIHTLIGDIASCKKELAKLHQDLPAHLAHLQNHLQQLLEQGIKIYDHEGFHRYRTDPNINDDYVFLKSVISRISNFGHDLRADNAHPKLEALSKVALQAHARWRDLFSADYPGIDHVRDEGMSIFKDLALLYHREDELEREGF